MTVKLIGGKEVYAKPGRHGLSAVRYGNRTQATHRAELLQADGIACHVFRGLSRAFYVAMESAHDPQPVV
jgi:hypothetical protein